LGGFIPNEVSTNNSLGLSIDVHRAAHAHVNQNRTGISFYPGYNPVQVSSVMHSVSKQDIDSTTAVNSASVNKSKVKNPHKEYNFHPYPV
jgi:hypothetical protein